MIWLKKSAKRMQKQYIPTILKTALCIKKISRLIESLIQFMLQYKYSIYSKY